MTTLKIPLESAVHRSIMSKLQERLKLGLAEQGRKHKEWRYAEENVLAYVPESSADARRSNARDNGDPRYTTMQIPYTYAMLLSAHTYWTSVFFARTPVHQFMGLNGEGEQQVQALEALINYQVTVGQMLGPYYIWLYEAGKYGVGILGTYWDKEECAITSVVENVMSTKFYAGYEGNRIYNVSPFDFIPDPRLPFGRFQDGEFCGVPRRLSWAQVKRRQANGFYMNVEKLPAMLANQEPAEQSYSALERHMQLRTFGDGALKHPAVVELFEVYVGDGGEMPCGGGCPAVAQRLCLPGSGETRHCTFERKGLTYWQCSACREQTTVICGTVFEATKLPLTTWFLAMPFLTQAKNNVSALELKRHLGVRYKTAWLLKHKLMQVMSEREAPRQLDGRVEIDDAYLGGELPGGKSGRGSENKVSFIAAVQTTEAGHPLKVSLKKLEFTKEAIADWAKTALAASAQVVSDGLGCFRAVTAAGATQERIVTGGGAARVKLEQFRAVNTFLGNLKTAYSGTYHAFDFAKYAHRYLAEVQYRFNRRFDLSSILKRLLVAAVATPPRPEHFLRAAEHCG